MDDEAILEAGDFVQMLTGECPEEITIEGDLIRFRINTYRSALCVIEQKYQIGPDPLYVYVNTQQVEDDVAEYSETLFFQAPPNTDEGIDGYILEGIYTRPINSTEPRGSFEGTLVRCKTEQDMRNNQPRMEQIWDLRTCKELMDYFQNEMRVVSSIINNIGDSDEAQKQRQRFLEIIEEAMRGAMSKKA